MVEFHLMGRVGRPPYSDDVEALKKLQERRSGHCLRQNGGKICSKHW